MRPGTLFGGDATEMTAWNGHTKAFKYEKIAKLCFRWMPKFLVFADVSQDGPSRFAGLSKTLPWNMPVGNIRNTTLKLRRGLTGYNWLRFKWKSIQVHSAWITAYVRYAPGFLLHPMQGISSVNCSGGMKLKCIIMIFKNTFKWWISAHILWSARRTHFNISAYDVHGSFNLRHSFLDSSFVTPVLLSQH